MAKEKSTSSSSSAPSKEERRALRKEKKEAGGKGLIEEAGVTKPKKEKKEKKAKREALTEKVVNELQQQKAEPAKKKKKVEVESEEEEGEEMEEDEGEEEDDAGVEAKEDIKGAPKKNGILSRPIGALVPFANPLADEKTAKKVFKSVKKAATHRTLKRGVKEVVKAIRRSPTDTSSSPTGVVVLAADISPMDVISHIPVLCEDHHIPYVYVTSRAELGMAGLTKRPTSVVMIGRDNNPGKKGKGGAAADAAGGEEDWADVYKALVKVVEREGVRVKV